MVRFREVLRHVETLFCKCNCQTHYGIGNLDLCQEDVCKEIYLDHQKDDSLHIRQAASLRKKANVQRRLVIFFSPTLLKKLTFSFKTANNESGENWKQK